MGTATPALAPSTCNQRGRLERRHERAAKAFEAARTAIRTRVGKSPKEEYLLLDRAADQAWDRLVRARRALDNHIGKHGCGIVEKSFLKKPTW